MASPQHAQQRDAGVPSPQIKQEIKQEGYASSMPPSRQSSMGLQSASGTTSRGPDYNDADGDVAMDDADPYKPKYNMSRPSHQHRHSQQFLQQEESAAARRYSPMNLSPTSPYSGNTQQGGQNYTSFPPQAQAQSQPQSNRQSPTRNNPYMSPPNSYYSPPCTSRSGWQGFLLVSTY
jgi:dual specificity protein kinase YAK1